MISFKKTWKLKLRSLYIYRKIWGKYQIRLSVQKRANSVDPVDVYCLLKSCPCLQKIKKSQLHILGVTSLLISTKYEEIYPPDLKDLLTVSENKFTKPEVLKMELQILMTL